MKVLTLSRSKLELGQSQLRKPLIVVGRSPTCDVVLRAPGIRPIHYLIEWIGSGKFDPSKGTWSIVDVSANAEAGEGEILGPDGILLGDIMFRVIDSKIESRDVIGGQIVEGLGRGRVREPEILEFVQVRTDSGAIEEVQHIALSNKPKIEPISHEFKTFKVEHPGVKTEHLLKVLADELPGATFLLSGKKIDPKGSIPLRPMDFLQVNWNGRDFYLRFVEEVDCPPIPRDFWGDPLLKRLAILGLAFIIGLTSYIVYLNYFKEEEEKVPELPRVARIEIPATPPPPPPAPETPTVDASKETKTVTPKQAVEKKAQAENITPVPQKEAPAKAAAPKMVKAPEKAPRAGLNTEAPTTDVNQVGLLGALNKTPKRGEGVKADQLLNQGLIKESATAQDNSKIVLRNPPAGVIGSGDGGSPQGRGNTNLGAASTTLSGIKKGDPSSQGLIARKGGESGFNMGSGSSGMGKGIGGSEGSGIGGLEGSDFSVAGGGLDRETVRRVILSYRSQVRTCYERALISNPTLQGRVVYQWKITPVGSVVTAQVIRGTIESSNLKTCVLEVIQKMQFPKAPNGMPTTVIYPFIFQGKN